MLWKAVASTYLHAEAVIRFRLVDHHARARGRHLKRLHRIGAQANAILTDGGEVNDPH